jgi:hypothetical protein
MKMGTIVPVTIFKEPAMAKASEILEIPATITGRGQTTVPAAIRKMLALGKRDQVVFRGLADGTVVIAKKKSVLTRMIRCSADFLSAPHVT